LKKQHKANNRKKQEDTFRHKHPFLSSFWLKNIKPLLLVTAVVSAGFIGVITWHLWGQYQDSVYWAEHHDENIVMADQPPSLLYDTDATSRNAKMSFTSLVQSVYDQETRDFTEEMNQESMDQLQAQLDQMTNDDYKQTYIDQFERLENKWTIEQAYRALYTNEEFTTIRADVTPHQIVALNNDTFEAIDEYSLDSNHTDQFAIRIHEWQTKLLEDVLTIQNQTLTLSQWLNQSDESYTVQADLYPGQLDPFVTSLEDMTLHYEWNNTGKLQTVVQRMQTITQKYQERHDAYNTYVADVEDGEEARAEHQQRLDTAKANLENHQEQINQARQELQENEQATRQLIDDLSDQLDEAKSRAEDEQQTIQEDAEQAIEDFEQEQQEERERDQQEQEEEETREDESENDEDNESSEDSSEDDDSGSDDDNGNEEESSPPGNNESDSSSTEEPSSSAPPDSDEASGLTEDALDNLVGEPLPEDLSIPHEIEYEDDADEETDNLVVQEYTINNEEEVVQFILGTE